MCQAAAVQECICQGKAVSVAVLDRDHVGCSCERRQGTGPVQIGSMTWGPAGRKELVLSRSLVQDDLHVCSAPCPLRRRAEAMTWTGQIMFCGCAHTMLKSCKGSCCVVKDVRRSAKLGRVTLVQPAETDLSCHASVTTVRTDSVPSQDSSY